MYCQYTYNMVGVIKVKTEVLRMLKETDDYLSGQEICERLNVSRTAVWKVIKQLEAEGYEIEAVRNRGYRLRFLAMFSARQSWRAASTASGLEKIFYILTETVQPIPRSRKRRRKMPRTVRWQLRIISRWERDAAEEAGRRRMGVGIWMSLLLRPELPPTCASMLTLVAALAVADGIRVFVIWRQRSSGRTISSSMERRSAVS